MDLAYYLFRINYQFQLLLELEHHGNQLNTTFVLHMLSGGLRFEFQDYLAVDGDFDVNT